MNSLQLLQSESKIWVAKNFPNRTRLQPIMGIVEEIGEYHESKSRDDDIDALADIMIFAADSCNCWGLNLEELWGMGPPIYATPMREFLVLSGRLCHAALKAEQNIRGMGPKDVGIALADIIALCNRQAYLMGVDLLEVTMKTWAHVKQRDWTKK